MPTDLDNWFVREVLVHERALALFLQRAWPHRDEWHDLRQETYARVYEAAARTRPDTPKAFLFTTARHLITDRLRRSRVVSIDSVGDMESLNVLVDEVSPERWSSGRQTLKRLAEAFDRLPDRCREVVWLRRVEELPQKEVAVRMGISEKTVEKQLAKGVRLIAGYFHMDEPVAAKQLQEPAPAGNGQAHGQQPAD
ncbi:sigma-70 family RNA polymerase sigma factor [Pseudoxanthomonas gei]|uniref:Sigma-70 family RNA polymerase sigma factor n=1 Tax=Pseudoxanthomonas gei TaxID=1383030 RepID=A0ABX0AI74_9GAMM|nr:sigma-70 family RNA polymerase sigma factor [Pseudoxanthomonas gei]NDK40150.1 sigma-70 family RNA polymerase sigma factor [Pseudoxanthomonas gei]